MHVTPLSIPEILLITPTVYQDARGFFFESFHQQRFNDAVGRSVSFVQDNHSQSTQGVLRGLHYQLPPRAQGKLVRAVVGAILDVAIDLRRGSTTFGRWVSAELSAGNKKQLWIPEGFGHGFITLSPSAELLYKTTDYYSKTQERVIRWDDPQIGIQWGIDMQPIVSEKDQTAVGFSDAEVF